MSKDTPAPAQASGSEHSALAQASSSDKTQLALAAEALSQQANEIGMTGVTGGAERLAITAGKGILNAPQGMVESVKEKGVLGVAATAVESAAVGAGLRLLMSKSAPIAEVAALALGTQFVAQSAPKFYDACAKGLHARTWEEMNNAGKEFGQASGGLVVDTAIGVAGFKAGAGGMGMTKWAQSADQARLVKLAELVDHARAKGLVPARLAIADAVESTAAHETAGAKGRDAALESGKTHDGAADASDKVVMLKKVVSFDHTVSMKELAEKDPERFMKTMKEYYPKLQQAFPDASEIESFDTYLEYLKDKDFKWDMLVLHDKEGNVLGGIQSQVVDVGGKEINSAVWAEHIWLAPEARTHINFRTLLKTAQDRWTQTGSDFVFMEFNDRAKMTWQQQLDDASAGLPPEAREKIWGRVGLYVLADESGRIAPYAQPAMGDGAPVEYLSIGMAPLKGKTLDGQSLPIDDYIKLLKAAHSTIPEVNLETDPTVTNYVRQAEAIKATGQDRLSFHKLKDTEVLRLINQRFIHQPNRAAIAPADAAAAANAG